jgi:biotin carboxylase
MTVINLAARALRPARRRGGRRRQPDAISSAELPARRPDRRAPPGRAAIVHPYSTGRHLAGAFGASGWTSVAVVPDRPLPVFADDVSAFRDRDYAAVVTDAGDIVATASVLAALSVTAVIAGTESGVELADALACRLGLPGNSPATSPSRRDKGLMADALARAGVPYARTIGVSTLGAAQAAARAIGGPVVVKPAASAASDNVTVCRSPQEIAAAWQAAAGQVNVMGLTNDELLVMEFLTGQQYMVNTVSYPGPGGRAAHYVAEVWLDRRREVPGGKVIYDRLDLLAGDDPRAQAAGAYIADVLDALGVVTGPAHSEMMVTSRGPRLIETNVRLAGMADLAPMERALGISQVGLAAEAVTDPAAFARRAARGPYRRLQHAVQLDLAATQPGILDGAALDQVRSLPTVCGWVSHFRPGDRIAATVDLATSPGHLFLVGPAGQLEADIGRIRALQGSGLFR